LQFLSGVIFFWNTFIVCPYSNCTGPIHFILSPNSMQEAVLHVADGLQVTIYNSKSSLNMAITCNIGHMYTMVRLYLNMKAVNLPLLIYLSLIPVICMVKPWLERMVFLGLQIKLSPIVPYRSYKMFFALEFLEYFRTVRDILLNHFIQTL
jgi:hypothetical protein